MSKSEKQEALAVDTAAAPASKSSKLSKFKVVDGKVTLSNEGGDRHVFLPGEFVFASEEDAAPLLAAGVVEKA